MNSAGEPISSENFRSLYEAHASFIWRTLRRLGVRAADLDDAVQEVFVVVHRKLPTWEGRSSLKTWIFGIGLRVAADFRKRAHVRKEASAENLPLRTTSGEWPLTRLAQEQARSLLDELLNELDEKKRPVFVLFELEGRPMQEVAEMLNVPAQTAYARLYAARRQIQKAISRLQPSR